MLARATVDFLSGVHKLISFFDIDNLTDIDLQSLKANVKASAVVVLFLDSETFTSQWVKAEIATAKECGIGVITVVDTDLYHSRELIQKSVKQGFQYCFDIQCIGFSTECTFAVPPIE